MNREKLEQQIESRIINLTKALNDISDLAEYGQWNGNTHDPLSDYMLRQILKSLRNAERELEL